MVDDIKLVVGVDYRELTGLIKTADQTKRTLSNVAKEFVNTGGQKQYMAAINRIVKSQQHLEVSSRMSRSQIMKLGVKMQQEVKFTNALTSATQRLSAAQTTSGKVMQQNKNKMNGNNMAIQQLGYQFGDFAVQVQGGTSAFVAFSQQGAQLAGILPMIAAPLGLSMGAAVGLSAALGILIPVGSAVARMFFEMSGSAEKAKDALGNTVNALDAYRRSVEFSKRSTSDLNLEFGEAATKLENMQELLQSVAVSRAMDSLSTGSSMFGKELDAAVNHMANLQVLLEGVKIPTQDERNQFGEEGFMAAREAVAGYQDEIDDAVAAIKLLPEEAKSLSAALKEVGKSESMEDIKNSSLAALEVIKGFHLEFGKIPLPIAEVIENLESVASAAARATHEVDKITDAEQDLLDVAKKLAKEPLHGPMTLLQIEAARMRDKMMGVFELTVELKDELGDAAFNAIKLADIDLSKGVSDAAREAAKLAANMNITLLAAMNIQNLQSSMEVGGGRGSGTEYTGQQDYTAEMDYETIQSQIDKFNKKNEPKATKAVKDPIGDFQKKLDLERELLGATEARQKVLQALGSDFVRNNPKQSAAMEAQIAKTFELIAVEEKRQALNDSITGSIEDGLMMMIDSTTSVKDAFKSMASEIVKELYRVLVVQQLVNAAKGFFGFADGGAFDGGSQIQAYANGGVVSSPTTFPMTGGKTGLMGEAGPEAIMPLKRGSNGKLGVQMEGGGGDAGDVITINQSFNFQANGDDSVKKLIAQAAPQIASLAKASIIESRRRGGSTKAAFG
tara:strand:+ start:4822 stop:7188 length:2367 start_codon:yes stop_codon:yes gene_type:complete